MKKTITIFSILLVLIINGCVQQTGQVYQDTLDLNLEVYPNPVYSGEKTSLIATLTNNAKKSYSNIRMAVFDPAYFSITGCNRYMNELRPYGVAEMSCSFRAPVVERDIISNIGISIRLRGNLPISHPVQMLGVEEYRISELTYPVQVRSGDATYSDENIVVSIEFSDMFPIVIRPREDYMYITIKNNRPNGYLKPLAGSGVTIFDRNNIIKECDSLSGTGTMILNKVLEPVGDEYPRISCILNKPQTKYLRDYGLIINVNYDYEIRETIPVQILS